MGWFLFMAMTVGGSQPPEVLETIGRAIPLLHSSLGIPSLLGCWSQPMETTWSWTWVVKASPRVVCKSWNVQPWPLLPRACWERVAFWRLEWMDPSWRELKFKLSPRSGWSSNQRMAPDGSWPKWLCLPWPTSCYNASTLAFICTLGQWHLPSKGQYQWVPTLAKPFSPTPCRPSSLSSNKRRLYTPRMERHSREVLLGAGCIMAVFFGGVLGQSQRGRAASTVHLWWFYGFIHSFDIFWSIDQWLAHQHHPPSLELQHHGDLDSHCGHCSVLFQQPGSTQRHLRDHWLKSWLVGWKFSKLLCSNLRFRRCSSCRIYFRSH